MKKGGQALYQGTGVSPQRRDPTAGHSGLSCAGRGQSDGARATKDQATRSSDAEEQHAGGREDDSRPSWPRTSATPCRIRPKIAVAADSVTPRVNPVLCPVTDTTDPYRKTSRGPPTDPAQRARPP